MRPTFFAEWLLYLAPLIAQGTMLVPFDKGRHAPVAAEDQARVIASILDNPGPHAGKVYPLYGPVELSQTEIASEIGKALGKHVEHKYADFDTFYEQLKSVSSKQTHKSDATQKSGSAGSEAIDYLGQHLREVAIDHSNGVFAGTNDVVQRVGGVPGTTVKEFVEKHRQAFESRN